jgi:NAD(P)-dependent dehydrogenase (short-subunit alcohol dehydrogenase family)
MKKILITGAGGWLGRGAALGLARAGHRVIATTKIWPQVTELRRHVAEQGLAELVTVDKVDVLDERDVRAAAAWDFDTFVSNAAVAESGPLAEIPVELVRRTFEINVFANLDLTQRIVRRWIDDGIAGRIVIVNSTGGLLTTRGLGAYCASKHALEAIAATLSDELRPTGITVQTINHGPYDTRFKADEADEADSAQITKGRFDPAEMVARMVEIIGAEDGSYRNVWPPAVEALVKQVQEAAWTRQI